MKQNLKYLTIVIKNNKAVHILHFHMELFTIHKIQNIGWQTSMHYHLLQQVSTYDQYYPLIIMNMK